VNPPTQAGRWLRRRERSWSWRPGFELPALAAAVVLALVVAGVAPAFRVQQWTLWAIYGLLALSFTFVWGHAGIFSFGQAAFFGIGGYAYGAATINLSANTGETFSSVMIAVAVAAAAAAVLGYFIFYGNVSDVYVAIITLAVTLVLLTVMSSTANPRYGVGSAKLGGYNGMIGIPPLSYGRPGGLSTPLSISALFVFVVVVAAAISLALRMLLRRPFGRVVAGVRENELRTQLLGFDVRRYKLQAFVLGGAVAGLAGALYAAWALFINPTVFGLQQAALVAIWVLVGGRTSFLGAFVGVVVVEGISSALGGSGGRVTPIVLGGILIAVVLLLPTGIVPAAVAIARRAVPGLRRPPAALSSPGGAGSSAAPAPSTPRVGAALEAVDLHKRFGGVTALNGASLAFAPRSINCLIGPNGAGKSTFFNLLVGRYRPTSGEIRFADRPITRRRPDQRARLGLGIKLQVPSLYRELPVSENVWLAAYARSRSSKAAMERTVAVLDWLKLLPRSPEPAGVLAHGQQQWLEIGMVLAGEPVVMLLDEPTAGMTREETLRTVELIEQVAAHATVIVVEHDMEFVRRLAVPVTVFHEGRVFARGSIEELRRDERILDIYLGRAAADARA